MTPNHFLVGTTAAGNQLLVWGVVQGLCPLDLGVVSHTLGGTHREQGTARSCGTLWDRAWGGTLWDWVGLDEGRGGGGVDQHGTCGPGIGGRGLGCLARRVMYHGSL